MPDLTIIAGCNGAGKSTFASSFLPDGQESFDYDKFFLTYYRALPDSEYREKFAKDKAAAEFELAIKNATDYHLDFCYETNFDVHPVYWAEKLKKLGYCLNLIFFCLEDQEIAKHRVEVRTGITFIRNIFCRFTKHCENGRLMPSKPALPSKERIN